MGNAAHDASILDGWLSQRKWHFAFSLLEERFLIFLPFVSK